MESETHVSIQSMEGGKLVLSTKRGLGSSRGSS
jgi:hypothetical protein